MHEVHTDTYHGAIAQKRTTGTPRVRNEVQRSDLIRLEVPERAPCRVAVDLQRVVRGAVEEEGESRGDDDGLDRHDSGRLILEVELPARRRGRGLRGRSRDDKGD